MDTQEYIEKTETIVDQANASIEELRSEALTAGVSTDALAPMELLIKMNAFYELSELSSELLNASAVSNTPPMDYHKRYVNLFGGREC